jgi:hypothetical protein
MTNPPSPAASEGALLGRKMRTSRLDFVWRDRMDIYQIFEELSVEKSTKGGRENRESFEND